MTRDEIRKEIKDLFAGDYALFGETTVFCETGGFAVCDNGEQVIVESVDDAVRLVEENLSAAETKSEDFFEMSDGYMMRLPSYVNVRVVAVDDPMGRGSDFINSAFRFHAGVNVREITKNADSNSIEIVENHTGKSDADLVEKLTEILVQELDAIPHAARPAEMRAF